MKAIIFLLASLFAFAQPAFHIDDPQGSGCLVLMDFSNPEDVDLGSHFDLSCVADLAMERRCLVPRGATLTLDPSLCGKGARLSLIDVAGAPESVPEPQWPIAWINGEVPEGGVELRCTETGLEADFLGHSLNQIEWIDCFGYPELTETVPTDLQALGFSPDLFKPKDIGHCLVLMNVFEPQDVDMGAELGLECDPNLGALPACRVPLNTTIHIDHTLCNEILYIGDVSVREPIVFAPMPDGGVELRCTETGLEGHFLGKERKRVEWVGCGIDTRMMDE